MSISIKKAQQEIKATNEPEQTVETKIDVIIKTPNYSNFLANKLGRIMRQGIRHKHAPLLNYRFTPGNFYVGLINKDNTQTLALWHRETDTYLYRDPSPFFGFSVSDPKHSEMDFIGYPVYDRGSPLPLFKKDIISTNLNVSENTFRFYILGRITGTVVRLRFDINMDEYFKTESTLDNQMIKMFARYLKGAYYGLPLGQFGNRKEKTWKERVDAGYAHLLKLTEDPIFNQNKKIAQKINSLKMELTYWSEYNSDDPNIMSKIYNEKVNNLTQLLRIMKAHRAQGLRKEFLDIILYSRYRNDWNLTTHAMAHYIKMSCEILNYIYRWHSDHKDIENYILQMMDICDACKGSGEKLKAALYKLYYEKSSKTITFKFTRIGPSPSKKNTSEQCSVKSTAQFFTKKNLMNSTTAFLTTSEMRNLSCASRSQRDLFLPELKTRKAIMALLQPVFKGDPIKVKTILKDSDFNKKLILEKTQYREGYYSNKLKKFVCFRLWHTVSPLQAAALCADHFLLRYFLCRLIENPEYRLEAATQLEEVLNKKVKMTAYSPEFPQNTDKRNNDTQTEIKKSAEERKKEAETTQPVQNSIEYLVPFNDLLKAYSDCINSPTLAFWRKVGEYQKRLPRYGLQIFLDTHGNILQFDSYEPRREALRYSDFGFGSLNLDDLGIRKGFLYKSSGMVDLTTNALEKGFAETNAEQFKEFCETQRAELEKLITCLQKPNSFSTFKELVAPYENYIRDSSDMKDSKKADEEAQKIKKMIYESLFRKR